MSYETVFIVLLQIVGGMALMVYRQPLSQRALEQSPGIGDDFSRGDLMNIASQGFLLGGGYFILRGILQLFAQ